MPPDIARALLHLASDESRYVTAFTLSVDSGETSAIGRSRFHQAPNELIREEAGANTERRRASSSPESRSSRAPIEADARGSG
jgi:hypothetical protein